MDKLTIILCAAIIFICGFNTNLTVLEAQPLFGTVSEYYDNAGNRYIYVKGYTRKDGTEVKGYYRSMPDGDKDNNLSTKGNINPFTGRKGQKKK